MKEIRKTLSGTEYWDEDAKKVVYKLSDALTKAGTSAAKAGKEISEALKKSAEEKTLLEKMTLDELLDHAKNKGIEVPGNIKKEETIRKYITDKL